MKEEEEEVTFYEDIFVRPKPGFLIPAFKFKPQPVSLFFLISPSSFITFSNPFKLNIPPPTLPPSRTNPIKNYT